MEELTRVLKAAKAAQEAYSHYTQEQVGRLHHRRCAMGQGVAR